MARLPKAELAQLPLLLHAHLRTDGACLPCFFGAARAGYPRDRLHGSGIYTTPRGLAEARIRLVRQSARRNALGAADTRMARRYLCYAQSAHGVEQLCAAHPRRVRRAALCGHIYRGSDEHRRFVHLAHLLPLVHRPRKAERGYVKGIQLRKIRRGRFLPHRKDRFPQDERRYGARYLRYFELLFTAQPQRYLRARQARYRIGIKLDTLLRRQSGIRFALFHPISHMRERGGCAAV